MVGPEEIMAALQQMDPVALQRLLPQIQPKIPDERPPTRVTIYNGGRPIEVWSVDVKGWLATGATLTHQKEEGDHDMAGQIPDGADGRGVEADKQPEIIRPEKRARRKN